MSALNQTDSRPIQYLLNCLQYPQKIEARTDIVVVVVVVVVAVVVVVVVVVVNKNKHNYNNCNSNNDSFEPLGSFLPWVLIKQQQQH